MVAITRTQRNKFRSLVRQIFLKHDGWVMQKLAKNSKKNWWLSAKIYYKSGYDDKFR